MTTKNIWGTLGLVVILAGGFWLLSKAAAPMGTTNLEVSTTTPPYVVATTTVEAPRKTPVSPKAVSEPGFTFGSTTMTAEKAVATFSSPTFTSSSTNPTVGGSANVKSLAIAVYNAKAEGLVATRDVAVVDGRWSYTVSVALAPGRYTLLLVGGAAPQNAVLTVTP